MYLRHMHGCRACYPCIVMGRPLAHVHNRVRCYHRQRQYRIGDESMYTKVSVVCALVAGLLLLSTCMGGAPSSTLSESAMRAAIGRVDCCNEVSNENCGTVGDGCKSCRDDDREDQLAPCPDTGKTIYNEVYHLCKDSGPHLCRVEGAITCGRYYFCEANYVDTTLCQHDGMGTVTCRGGPWPHYHCRTCERGEWTGSPDHTVIDYYCQ